MWSDIFQPVAWLLPSPHTAQESPFVLNFFSVSYSISSIMASRGAYGPTLMGIPSELRGMILARVVEDNYVYITTGVRKAHWYTDWQMAVLTTSRLLHEEGVQAMREQLTRCGLSYHDSPPPTEDYFTRDEDQDNDEVQREKRKHKTFLIQYGDCVTRVNMYHGETYRAFSLHWFPNLKILELCSLDWEIKATSEDYVYVGGKLKKQPILAMFRYRYRNKPDSKLDLYQSPTAMVQSAKGVDREYEVHVQVWLEIPDGQTWVR